MFVIETKLLSTVFTDSEHKNYTAYRHRRVSMFTFDAKFSCTENTDLM